MTAPRAPFCAVCTGQRGPFARRPLGKGDAMVDVCASCDGDAPVARYHDRGYEMPPEVQRIGRTVDAFAAAANRVTGDDAASNRRRARDRTLAKEVSPGFVLVRLSRFRADGTARDTDEAMVELRGESWFSELRRLGSTRRHHLFERPDIEVARAARSVANHDPMEALISMSEVP